MGCAWFPQSAVHAVSRRDGAWNKSRAAQGDTEDWPSLTAASSSSSAPQLGGANCGAAERPVPHSTLERRLSDSDNPALAAQRSKAGTQGAHPPAGGSRAENGHPGMGQEVCEELDWDSLAITRSQSQRTAGASTALHQAERYYTFNLEAERGSQVLWK